MIHKARFNAIIFLLALVSGLGFGAAWGSDAAVAGVFLALMIWFFTMLASFIKLAFTGKPLLYNVKVTATKDGDYTEH